MFSEKFKEAEDATERKWQEANGKTDPRKRWDIVCNGVVEYEKDTWDDACDMWAEYDEEDIGGVTVFEILPATATNAAMAEDVTAQVEEYIGARLRRRGIDDPQNDEY